MIKRLFGLSVILALAIMIMLSPVILAAPGLVTNLTANPSNTSIVLAWDEASGSTSTVIRYATDDFPANPAAGTSAYSGSDSQCTVSSLTAGQVYYFAAWGYDGADYSASSCDLAMSTLAVALPSGGEDEPTTDLPTISLPDQANQAPDASGLSLEPFTSIITYFNDEDIGGFGMPSDNAWEFIVILGIVSAGSITYIRVKQFFVAFGFVFILSCIAVGLDLVQGYLVVFEIIIGAGVWAVERYLQ